MTITLLTDSNGMKMGKTAGNAVWLDAEKTPPYDFFQYWRNVADADVIKCIKMLTFLPLDEIREMENWEGSQLNKAKEILAYELTKLVHGEEKAEKALEAAHAVFGGSGSSENMPTVEFENSEVSVIDALVAAKLAPSRAEARRLIQQGGVSVNDEKVADISKTVDISGGAILKKGKKQFVKLIVK